MLFGDAKSSVNEVTAELKALSVMVTAAAGGPPPWTTTVDVIDE